MKRKDAIDLPEGDFRRKRQYLAPWAFALPGDEEGKTYPPPSDLVAEKTWDGIMVLPDDVALKSSSYDGSLIGRLYRLQSDWIFSWPEPGDAPFMQEPALLAGEEFDALVFNALETLTIAAGLAASDDRRSFDAWRRGERQFTFGHGRTRLRNSVVG